MADPVFLVPPPENNWLPLLQPGGEWGWRYYLDLDKIVDNLQVKQILLAMIKFELWISKAMQNLSCLELFF